MVSFFSKIFGSSSQDKEKTKPTRELLSTTLQKSKTGFFGRIVALFSTSRKLDAAALLEEVEGILLSADVGLATTAKILERLDVHFEKQVPASEAELSALLKQELQLLFDEASVLQTSTSSLSSPQVILIVGINGVGKTTSIAKLAHLYQNQDQKIMLGAADTFRAAAAEQLTIWAERLQIPIVKQKQGADPASVAFDTLQSAKAKQMDVVIIDTAGRLHKNNNLMRELTHIKRVIQKFDEAAPHEVLLVLDASTGQNAIAQAKEFAKATQVTGIILTKLDGSAKGGVVFGIVDQLQIPIRYLGVGERLEDMIPFERDVFLEMFFKKQESSASSTT